jgi:hydrogenase maturation protease
MPRIVVFGYGNPLRGDDGAGWRVAETVAERWTAQLVVRTGHQLLPEWAADLHRADVVYFVDASIEVDEPTLEPVSRDCEVAPIDGHSLGPRQLLRVAHEVFGRAPSGLLLHVPAISFGFGETLSPAAASGVRQAACLLNTLLESQL